MESIGESIKDKLQITTERVSMMASRPNTQPQKKSTVSREQIVAMVSVLNKLWLSRSWRIMDPKDAEPMALAYIELLTAEGIGHEHYQPLYQQAVAFRAEQIRQGKQCPDFSAELMISCWPALREQINFDRQNKITIDRQLEMGGEPCPNDVKEQLRKLGVKISG